MNSGFKFECYSIPYSNFSETKLQPWVWLELALSWVWLEISFSHGFWLEISFSHVFGMK